MSKQDIAMAYAIKKKAAKKMAKGGKVAKADKFNPEEHMTKLTESQVAEGKARLHNTDLSPSKLRTPEQDRDVADKQERRMRKMAEGGMIKPIAKSRPDMVEGSLKVRPREEVDAETMGPAKAYEDEYHQRKPIDLKQGKTRAEVEALAQEKHRRSMEDGEATSKIVEAASQGKYAKGGQVKETEDRPDVGWGAIIFKGEGGEVKKSEAVPLPPKTSEQPPEQQVLDYKQLRKQYIEKNRMNRRKMAEGGEVELDEDASMAAAIMAKRKRMAEGGAVDIEENNEEQPNAFYDLNEDAALKENYDSDMVDLEEPMDSNLLGDSHEDAQEDILDEDTVSAIRRRMKSRSAITK